MILVNREYCVHVHSHPVSLIISLLRRAVKVTGKGISKKVLIRQSLTTYSYPILLFIIISDDSLLFWYTVNFVSDKSPSYNFVLRGEKIT